jgi:ATP-dependent 26S proteasome regulatory subunit
MIDDNHAIVASAMGPEYYVSVMSFVNRDLLEPGCSVLLHNKVWYPSNRGTYDIKSSVAYLTGDSNLKNVSFVIPSYLR